jgi:ATP-dependent DNA helicase RecG
MAARERLDFFAGCTDGFALAQYDLDTRGPGDLFGEMQSGESSFSVASVADTPLMERAAAIAQQLVGETGEVERVLDQLWFGRKRNIRAAHME